VELPGRTREANWSRSTLILALYAALALVALVIGLARGQADLYRLPGVEASYRLLLSPLVGVALGLTEVFAYRLCVHRFDWARRLHRDFRGLLADLSARDVLILAGASAIGEELLFRGALMPWVGVIGSTLIFALLHVGPGTRFLPWTASAFVIGLVFCLLFRWLGDLGAPILAHFTINYMNIQYIQRVELPPEGDRLLAIK
jgi:membrane protease YdiL (CAAX protease family)